MQHLIDEAIRFHGHRSRAEGLIFFQRIRIVFTMVCSYSGSQDQLLAKRRLDDKGKDLETTVNAVQEKSIPTSKIG